MTSCSFPQEYHIQAAHPQDPRQPDITNSVEGIRRGRPSRVPHLPSLGSPGDKASPGPAGVGDLSVGPNLSYFFSQCTSFWRNRGTQSDVACLERQCSPTLWGAKESLGQRWDESVEMTLVLPVEGAGRPVMALGLSCPTGLYSLHTI